MYLAHVKQVDFMLFLALPVVSLVAVAAAAFSLVGLQLSAAMWGFPSGLLCSVVAFPLPLCLMISVALYLFILVLLIWTDVVSWGFGV